jgi:hypothetical protein
MNDECVICFEDIDDNNMIKLKCKHSFHKDCIVTLLRKRNRKCPLCRNRITWTVNSILGNNYLPKKRKRSDSLASIER